MFTRELKEFLGDHNFALIIRLMGRIYHHCVKKQIHAFKNEIEEKKQLISPNELRLKFFVIRYQAVYAVDEPANRRDASPKCQDAQYS